MRTDTTAVRARLQKPKRDGAMLELAYLAGFRHGRSGISAMPKVVKHSRVLRACYLAGWEIGQPPHGRVAA